ncbi:putative D-Xylulose kinase [Piedraia hortae CBS 480.64]|uniref:Xylulose kinase n=1 Tax=Piedraia hortae CBS 480.64 TaxID=1314780 RepID=A0A6A7C1P5_9PEZI|nr:putative D-Xylulose kinase [Piedraia hortae CBS 480.64]
MGFDLSTQQLKCVCVDSKFVVQYEAKVDFDDDLAKYGIEKGVLSHAAEGEVFAPPAMWLEAVDLVLDRLHQEGLDFGKIKGLSGAGMQHGTVFWNSNAEHLLSNLDPEQSLVQQLSSSEESKNAFAHPMSPNWQDASTQTEVEAFDSCLGDAATLAKVTGSKAHHRFSGPQILRYRKKYPEHYYNTARISLVSSFFASIFLGTIAPIDISDVTGMNLWDIHSSKWHGSLLELTAGGKSSIPSLISKLSQPNQTPETPLGTINPYFITRFGFPPDCQVQPFTGDNPSTILSLPLLPGDAVISLGTSTTFLMSTPTYLPSPEYHLMNHPATKNLYMFMLCYKNGGLARELVRDQLNNIITDYRITPNSTSDPTDPWAKFNSLALSTPPLSQPTPGGAMRMGLYFPKPEIVPPLRACQYRFLYTPAASPSKNPPARGSPSYPSKARGSLDPLPPTPHPTDALTILESQFLSIRQRSNSPPKKIYLVGGGSSNPAIARVCGDVLSPEEGVFTLKLGGNACALGSAYRAVWAGEGGQGWEEFIDQRWRGEVRGVEREEGRGDLFELYGIAAQGFREMERLVVEEQKRAS